MAPKRMTPPLALNLMTPPLAASWPWHDALPALQLVSTRFSLATSSPADLLRFGIEMPSPSNAAPRRRAEYLAGRRCAGEALRRLTGEQRFPPSGADRAPIWPHHTVGSITHCNWQALALVGRANCYRGLGIDLEQRLSDSQARELMPMILTDRESRHWGSRVNAFLVSLTFSAKESLFKALYPLVRQRFYFDAAELIDWRPNGEAVLRLCRDLDSEWRTGTEIYCRYCDFNGHLLTRVAIARQPARTAIAATDPSITQPLATASR